MALYFFDTYDGGIVTGDDVGVQYANLELVKAEAAKTLAEIARDVVPGTVKRELAVSVRDKIGSVLMATMLIELVILRIA
jgi:hypothetical protein